MNAKPNDNEIVKALRCSGNENAQCKTCKYAVPYKDLVGLEGHLDYCDDDDLQRDAADLIESQTAEITALTECKEKLAAQNRRLIRRNSDLADELTASQRRADKAVEDLKANWLCMSCTKRVVGNEWSTCPYVAFVSGAEQVITCANHEWRGEEADGEKVQNG